MKPRPKGVVVYRSPENPAALEAEKNQKQERLRLQTQRGERRERPVPNYVCYSFLFPNYDRATGKGAPRPLPKCRVCEATLFPTENHKCEGFTPKYVEHDEEWHERQEAKRDDAREMREERRQEIRESRMEMIREARLNGELYGREDDGHEDDDGWECEDDGVYGDDDGWDCD